MYRKSVPNDADFTVLRASVSCFYHYSSNQKCRISEHSASTGFLREQNQFLSECIGVQAPSGRELRVSGEGVPRLPLRGSSALAVREFVSLLPSFATQNPPPSTREAKLVLQRVDGRGNSSSAGNEIRAGLVFQWHYRSIAEKSAEFRGFSDPLPVNGNDSDGGGFIVNHAY